MELKLTKTQPKDLGVVRHQMIPKKHKGKEISVGQAQKWAENVAKKLGYKQVLFYQEHEKSYEFRLLSRDKKWKAVSL